MDSDRHLKKRLESIIQFNFRDKHFNVKKLSRIYRASPSHLRELVKKHYGFSPHKLIENVRLENSFEPLMGDDEIADIALDTGFANAQSYRRTFKRRLNILPSEFRKLFNKSEENKEEKLKIFRKYLWINKKSSFLPGDFAS